MQKVKKNRHARIYLLAKDAYYNKAGVTNCHNAILV